MGNVPKTGLYTAHDQARAKKFSKNDIGFSVIE